MRHRLSRAATALCALGFLVPACHRRARARVPDGLYTRTFAGHYIEAAGPPGHFLMGGLRLEVGPRDVTLSAQRFGLEVLAVAHLERGWVFVTDDGAVAAGPTFTGPLRDLGPALVARGAVDRAIHRGEPSPLTATGHTSGRLAVVARGAVWTTDGASLVRAAPTPSPALVAAFADAQRGLAALADGRLARTRDGGASWALVPLGNEHVLAVQYLDASLRVQTLTGWHALDDGERLGEALAPEPASEPSEAASRALAAYDARLPEVRPARGLALRNGARLTAYLPHQLVLRGRDGRALARTPVAEDETALARWGASAVLLGNPVRRTDDGLHWRAVQGFTAFAPTRAGGRIEFGAQQWRGHAFALSDDGVHAVFSGRCNGDASVEDAWLEPWLCALRDGRGAPHEWRPVELAGGQRFEYRGMHGARLLFTVSGAREPHRVLDTDTGTVRPVPCADADTPCERVEWTPDGHVWGTLAPSLEEATPRARSVAMGPAEGPFTVHPAPRGTTRVALTDGGRGLALTEWGELWRTLDAGQQWTQLELQGAVAAGDYLGCSREGCWLDSLQLWGWGATTERGPALFAPAPALPE